MEKVRTMASLLQAVAERYSNSTHLNYRYHHQWEHISTESFVETVHRFALGLKSLGLQPGDGFGILADPSPHWLMVDLAVIIAGGVSVPMFANISSENLEFEITDSNMKFLFVARDEKWMAVRSRSKAFQWVVSQSLEISGGNIIHFDDVLTRGDDLSRQKPDLYSEMCESVQEDAVATIIYTSGSTGMPKGVEITHRNLISQVQDAKNCFPLNPREDTILSCLPLAHIFERMVMYYYFSTGCSIYFADDVKKVGELLPEVKPTIMTIVPRILEKVHAKMSLKLSQSSGIKRRIGELAFQRASTRDPDEEKGILQFVLDRMVYSKLRQALGGRLRMLIVGGAAMNRSIGRFFLNAGLPVYEGYGLTEASPVISANYPGNRKLGSVGKPLARVEVKISEEGEILARGPNIMRGYHNNPEATSKAIDPEGWLHTGDKGEIDADGYVWITGRFKELFKTSNGKYVSPVPIEQALSQHEFVDISIAIAENRNYVTCLLVPDFEKLQDYKEVNGYGKMENGEFFKSDFLQQEMNALLSTVNKRLNHWEKVQKFQIIPVPLTIETGEITPTMKVRRHVVEKKFEAEINRMYAEAGA